MPEYLIRLQRKVPMITAILYWKLLIMSSMMFTGRLILFIRKRISFRVFFISRVLSAAVVIPVYFFMTAPTFSKEHRTTPIVQLGLFTDRRGIPLGFSVFNGSQSEQISLTPLEEKILNDFNLPDSRLIVCTDSGLASFDNKEFNAKTHLIKNSLNCITTDYITIRPLRKMDAVTLEWALNRGRSLTLNPIKDGENPDKVFAEIERTGWRTEGSNRVFSLDEIDEDDPENYNRIFYKEKYVIITPSGKSKNKGKTLEERLIVTYSIKYKHFMQHKRLLNLNKASRMIAAKNSKKLDLKASDSVRKFIQIQSVDNKGNTITDSSNRYSLDEAAILEDARYDGFYAVSTNISPEVMPVKEIITVNKGRWEIEESFMIMKTEMRSRPVYLQNSERIKAHFTQALGQDGTFLLQLLETVGGV